MTCDFCAIAAGTGEASTVFADDDLLAFADIRPVTPGHLLVVPRAHATALADLPPDTCARLFPLAQRLAAALRTALGCAGVNLFLADGATAGQEVFHVHLHVIPRYPADGFGVHSRPTTPPRTALDTTASTIRTALNR